MKRLRNWNDLTEEVRGLPEHIGVALATGRSGFLKAQEHPRAFTLEETQAVTKLIGVLMDTNMELQQHSQKVADMLFDAGDNLKGLVRKIDQAEDLANFRGE